jgi:hypothetical protein
MPLDFDVSRVMYFPEFPNIGPARAWPGPGVGRNVGTTGCPARHEKQ